MAKLYSPAGTLIIGTKDIIPGVATIQEDTFVKDEDGSLDFEWAGGTNVDWDGQKTVTRQGQRVFVCEDGDEWLENQLTFEEPRDD